MFIKEGQLCKNQGCLLFFFTGYPFGYPIEAEELEYGLAKLARELNSLARPDYGKYVN
ncbi:hypothetical protein LAV79_11825 [Peribacillus butanolivorans]|uniref:hypothetical protein n=1 Tax=Peribacillus butanolivorans TaxID=421767 RepID=UPI0030C99E55